MKKSLLILLLFSTLDNHAQITLNSSNVPPIGTNHTTVRHNKLFHPRTFHFSRRTRSNLELFKRMDSQRYQFQHRIKTFRLAPKQFVSQSSQRFAAFYQKQSAGQ